MENLHEMGWRERQKRERTAKLAAGIGAGVLIAGLLLFLGARIDGLERELAQAQAQTTTDEQGLTRTDTVTVHDTTVLGLQTVRLQDGELLMRFARIGNGTKGTDVTNGKGKK